MMQIALTERVGHYIWWAKSTDRVAPRLSRLRVPSSCLLINTHRPLRLSNLLWDYSPLVYAID